MNSFKELRKALFKDDSENRIKYDRADGRLETVSGRYTVSAYESGNEVTLEVCEGDRKICLQYGYEKAHELLSTALRDDAELRVLFWPRAPKSAEKVSPAGIGCGAVIALLSAFCTLAMLAAGFSEPGDRSLFFALAVFFGLLTASGIALIASCVRKKATPGKIIGIGSGVSLSLFPSILIYAIWYSRAADPDTPLHVYIALTAAFGLLVASGIMLIVTTLRGGRKTASAVVSPRLAVVPSAENARRLIEAVKEQTAAEAVGIRLEHKRKPGLSESKIGGIPYWDIGKPYPALPSGRKLTMLAQFDLCELPRNRLLPAEGMLQFFILADEEYGLNSLCRVVYHREINRSISEQDVTALDIPTSFDDSSELCFPVIDEFAVRFEKNTVYMDSSDVRFADAVRRAAAELGIELYDAASDDFLIGCIWDDAEGVSAAGSTGHRLGGYPHFTQDDPRSVERAEVYDTLLFQLDTDLTIEDGRMVMWGDAGTGNFFINSNRLAQLDFDDVLYNWDCC